MPISDMRKDGNGLNPMGEIDSNGSSDSVVSFNSCFSDESLEYLSAEEKACLMYLEETIQSLDTEDDSGLSNDEPDQLPARGNVANKAAHLSASVVLNKAPSQEMSKRQFESPLSSSSFLQNEILDFMVPTPFVLANRNSQIKPRSELAPLRKVASESVQLHQEAPKVPSEVNVVVVPPPQKIKGSRDTVKEQQNNEQRENAMRRGPLSYEALVHLRKSASMRRTNETEAKQQVSTTKDVEGSTSDSQNLTSRSSKPTPPPVAPKPKIKPTPKVPVNQEGQANSSMPCSGILTVDKLMNPEKIRVEALCKLGLLKQDTMNPVCQQVKHSQSTANVEQIQSTSQRLAPSIPSRSEGQKNQPIQSCNSLHQRSVSDLSSASFNQQHADLTSTRKSGTLERTGVGLSNSKNQSCSLTTGDENQNKGTQMNANESTPRKPMMNVPPSRSKGYNVPVPSIGKDRREALRKLGLLKN